MASSFLRQLFVFFWGFATLLSAYDVQAVKLPEQRELLEEPEELESQSAGPLRIRTGDEISRGYTGTVVTASGKEISRGYDGRQYSVSVDSRDDDDFDSDDYRDPNWPFYMQIMCNLWYTPQRCCGFKKDAKYIFVTSTEFSADLRQSGVLGGVTGADAICQQHATASGLDGLFKAWIATSKDDTPQKRFSRHRGNYIRRDNAPLYQCWDRLVSGREPENTFWMDEKKNLLTSTTQGAATNLNAFGFYYENSENVIGSCFDFTYDATRGTDLSPSEGIVGVSESGFGLRPDMFMECDKKIRLICVEQ